MVMTRPPAYHPGNFLMKNMNPTNSGLIYITTISYVQLPLHNCIISTCSLFIELIGMKGKTKS